MNKKFLLPLMTICAIGLVMAGYYAYATVTLNINNLDVGGNLEQTTDCEAGESCLGEAIDVENDLSSDRNVSISDNSGGKVDVFYVGKLDMENKDSSDWTVIEEDDREGTLYYTVTGEEMKYHFEGAGLESEKEYKLIYYLDSGETDTENGKPWNMDNAVLINSGDSDSEGNLVLEGSKEFSSDLPYNTDYNKNPNEGDSYCNNENGFDDYEHCSGAKIWLITGDISNSNWNPDEWLFETDMIHYFDNTAGNYTIKSGSSLEFYPVFDVGKYAEGEKTITITVA